MRNVLLQHDLPRPWEKHRVTVCIPYLDTPEVLSIAVRLWQLQDETPFLLIIDNGSLSEASAELLAGLAQEPSIEVSRLGILSEVEHRSDRVAIAMDYAFARCPTEYLLAVHVDVFPKHRRVISKLRGLCDASTPVVGWEMSPRGQGMNGNATGALSDGISGHACTMFHLPTMDRIGAAWSMRRAHHEFGLPRSYTRIHGWPDTEVCLGRILARHGIEPLFLGRETNDETQETEDWTHARSSTIEWLVRGRPLDRQAIAYDAARARIVEWELDDLHAVAAGKSPIGAVSAAASNNSAHHNGSQSGFPKCHSRREIPHNSTSCFCAHPFVHARGSLVTREVCNICQHRQLPAPERFRPFFPALVALGMDFRPKTVAVFIVGTAPPQRLGETLDSSFGQTYPPAEVIVLDQSGAAISAAPVVGDSTREIRVVYVSQQPDTPVIDTAVAATSAEILCFVKAGDILSPEYLERGLLTFSSAAVGVSVGRVEPFGAGPDHGRSSAGAAESEHDSVNGSLILRAALEIYRESETADRADPAIPAGFPQNLERILAAGGWECRRHHAVYHARIPEPGTHGRAVRVTDVGLRPLPAAPLMTLFVPLSGRSALWSAFSEFLDRQTWPHDRLQLILMDTSQDVEFGRMVRAWIANCDYSDVRYLQQSVGERGLADRPRLAAAPQVGRAMARIYRRLARDLATDFVWIVEDDVLPPLDACARLCQGFDQGTASVSATYGSRFGNAYVAWDAGGNPRRRKGSGLENIGGNGFGCVVLRAEALRNTPLSPTASEPACDAAFYAGLRAAGLTCKLDWSVECEHRTALAAIP